MRGVLSAAGRSFLRAFVASVVLLAPGVLAAPDLNQTKVLGVAALIASLAAGFKALQVFVPQLAFGGKYGELANSFVRAFLGAFLTSIIGILDAPDLSTLKSVAFAALVGALTAGIRAVQGFFTVGDYPAPQKGFVVADREV
jgi:hypothetical protein